MDSCGCTSSIIHPIIQHHPVHIIQCLFQTCSLSQLIMPGPNGVFCLGHPIGCDFASWIPKRLQEHQEMCARILHQCDEDNCGCIAPQYLFQCHLCNFHTTTQLPPHSPLTWLLASAPEPQVSCLIPLKHGASQPEDFKVFKVNQSEGFWSPLPLRRMSAHGSDTVVEGQQIQTQQGQQADVQDPADTDSTGSADADSPDHVRAQESIIDSSTTS